MTPPEAIKAANIINRSENLRCMNCTADFSNHSVAGRWLISPFPLLDPYDCYYVDHSGLVEIADSICKRSWDAIIGKWPGNETDDEITNELEQK